MTIVGVRGAKDDAVFRKCSSPSYDHFIRFVRTYIAPYMKRPFVEEPFYRELWDATWENRFVDIQIGRGHGKTEFLAVWRPIFIGVYQFENPHFYAQFGKRKVIRDILIVGSDSMTSGEIFSRLKFYMNASPVLEKFLPKNASDDDGLKDNTEKLTLTNGTTFYCRSIKMKRGLHPDLIILDDLTTESSTLTDTQTWDLFSGAVMPMSTANAAIVTIDGTPIRSTDIMSRVRNTKTVNDALAYNITEGEEQSDYSDVWYHVHLPAINEQGKLLSEHRFTRKILDDVRRVIGSRKFEAEYLLNPFDDESALIKGDWFDQCLDIYHTMTHNRGNYDEVYLGWDFAFSNRSSADNAVGAIIGRLDGKLYLIDMVVMRGTSAMEQLERIKELHVRYRFDMIALEENSITSIRKEVGEIKTADGSLLPLKMFRLTAYDEKESTPLLNKDIINVGKQNFIMRLATTFENKEITLPASTEKDREHMRLLRAECLSWAFERTDSKSSAVGTTSQLVLVEIGPHPDRPVALGYALEASKLNNFIITW